MGDIKSISNMPKQKSDDRYMEQLREQIGKGFTDEMKKGHKRNEMGKDDFLKLMTAQLKYQDPMSPMKNEEMAAQLAQFSALEQMMNVNQNLEKMSASQKPSENMLAASLIGKRVVTEHAKFNFDKKSEPTIKFDLPADTAETTVAVANEKGETVREIKLGSMKQGPQSIKWDGKSDKGMDQAEGIFSFHVTAKDQKGKSVEVKTTSSGQVNGVVFEQGKAMLLVDDKKLPLEAITRIENAVEPPKPAAPAPAAAPANPLTEKKENKQNMTNAVPDQTEREKIISSLLPSASKSETIKNMEAPPEEDLAAQDVPMPLWNPNL